MMKRCMPMYKNVLGHNEPKTLMQAKDLQEWPDWEEAIKAELQQLAQKRMWELIKCPNKSIPIANKWVFIRKYNKKGNLTKYKVRLVAKGCTQCPGYDYQEMYSPIVCMETIRVILAMAAIKDLKIQQMDVKGAYLNGTLMSQMHISFSVFCVEVLIIRYDKMVSHMMSTCAFVFIMKAQNPEKDLPYSSLDTCIL
jgi:hypothetical protein